MSPQYPGGNYYGQQGRNQQHQNQRQGGAHQAGQAGDQRTKLPYTFVDRPCLKKEPEAKHDKVLPDRVDLALEVVWTAETPLALNPTEDPQIPRNKPRTDKETDFQGFNRRWLTTPEGKPMISPFTVKGAVAAAFANLVGGCYRVPDRLIPHTHSVDPGTFKLTGRYKKYRVNMDRMSKPAILESTSNDPDTGKKLVVVRPVKEIHYFGPMAGLTLTRGNVYYGVVTERGAHKYKIADGTLEETKVAAEAVATKNKFDVKLVQAVVFDGDYLFGMNLGLNPGNGDLRKWPRVRFYQPMDASYRPLTTAGGIGNPALHKRLEGLVDASNFLPSAEAQKLLHMGSSRKVGPNSDKDPRTDGQPWWQDLGKLEPGDFIYYEHFPSPDAREPSQMAIGRNFQFKTIFPIEDAVPSKSRACVDRKKLCPRCALFGMVQKREGGKSEGDADEKEGVGFRGRFKSAALICEKALIPATPSKRRTHTQGQVVDFATWNDQQGQQLAYQTLLPVAATPKPSRRDVNGYFKQDSGMIKGAKAYRHFNLPSAINIGQIDTKEQLNQGEDMEVAHNMRNYVQAIVPKTCFSGVLGAENVDAIEVAALLVALDTRVAGFGFKIGLGKAFGLGSVASQVRIIWIRRPGQEWRRIEIPEVNGNPRYPQILKEQYPELLKEEMKGIGGHINLFGRNVKTAQKLAPKETVHDLPSPGLRFWRNASTD